jgi:aspartyl-tRNA(Asn)/glutamyl-tRNA(Gln) amidotransferase subunit C
MKFTTDKLQAIADLARLDLSQAELLLYGEQLSGITGYIEKLKLAPTNDVRVEKELYNVWREDQVSPWDLDESVRSLSEAEREAGLIKVKRVL